MTAQLDSHRRTPPSSLSKPIIALLTDFGLGDHYVATMKGMILRQNADVHLVDISHDVHPQCVREAGYLLWASYRYFPDRTIFGCVVDPGVGSDRNIVIVERAPFVFVAPDNGLLDFVLSEPSDVRIYQIGNDDVRRLATAGVLAENVSSTFHGRDIFAPLIGLLSRGEKPDRFGRACERPKPPTPFFEGLSSQSHAHVLHIDQFGNIVTNIRVSSSSDDRVIKALRIGERSVEKWVSCYADAPEETPVMIKGSNDLVELVVRQSSAARLLSAQVEMSIEVFR